MSRNGWIASDPKRHFTITGTLPGHVNKMNYEQENDKKNICFQWNFKSNGNGEKVTSWGNDRSYKSNLSK